MSQKKQVPEYAMSIPAGTFQLAHSDEEDGMSPRPVSMIALSGKPLNHWWMGMIVQDLSGMSHPEKITIDWNHNDNEIMGFVDEFDTADSKLALDGALTPFNEGDRASEVIHKEKLGVPYESSIFFPPREPGDTVVEEVEAGAEAEVNGEIVHGPITIFRKWHLSGVAITPHGADNETSAFVQNSNSKTVEIDVMKNKNKGDEPTPDPTKDAPTEPAATADPVAASPADESREVFKLFIGEFGKDLAATYFAEGISLEDARAKYTLHLKAENTRLRTEAAERLKLDPDAGVPTPADLEDDEPESKLTPAQNRAFKEHCLKMRVDPEEKEKIRLGIIENNRKRAEFSA